MTITYHRDLIQGSDEWLEARRGIITASEMKLILTPTIKVADNDKSRAHLYELLAQRISGFVEPTFIGDDMLRGMDDEVFAKAAYNEHIAHLDDMGFITNNKWGFTIGYSPDGLVGADGLIEVKSRRQKYQVQTIVENAAAGTIPTEYVLQAQTGLMVSERQWLDFISYCGGLPMTIIRVYPDPAIQDAIIGAVAAFEANLEARRIAYHATMQKADARFIPTERRIEQQIYV